MFGFLEAERRPDKEEAGGSPETEKRNGLKSAGKAKLNKEPAAASYS